MRNRLKSYFLVACLFVFLLVVIGAGLHLNPLGAFMAALSGTPLVIHAANRWGGVRARTRASSEAQIARGQAKFTVTENGEEHAEHVTLRPS